VPDVGDNEPLQDFLRALAARADDERVQNPYRLPGRLANLEAYLRAQLTAGGRRMLLVGEAPGYRGCLLTGIPFSSPRLLRAAPHPMLRRLLPALELTGDGAEATASLVWQGLARRRTPPLCWNAFPFHPHRTGEPDSNRAPDAAELREGMYYLQRLAQLYNPQLVVGVGRKGAAAARRALPHCEIIEIRHPSHGGKAAFDAGLRRAYRRRVTAGRG
jgi:uracil-DNA glycosylase